MPKKVRLPRKRKVIAYLAVSADGYIARPDGDVEWLNRRPHNYDYGMKRFYASIDTILLGRKTYDWAVKYYRNLGKPPDFDPKVPHLVFSRNPPRRALGGVQFVTASVRAFMRKVRATPGKHIWMMGGGGLIASFLDAGELDEFDIHVMPTLIGDGIPMIQPRHRDIELTLLAAKKYPDGVVRLRYGVNQA
jgi:dihydrofolate reductase